MYSKYTYKELFIDKIYGELLEFIKLNNPSILKISITLNNYCNYKCKYCITDTPNTVEKHDINKEYLKLFFYYLRKINFNTKFRVNLLGGEPTLYKDINYVIDSIFINYPNTIVNILTNGSASMEYYENLIKKYNIKLDFSYHPEFANDNHFLDIINMLKENDYHNYNIKILLEYEYYDKIINFINKTDKTKLEYTVLAGIDYNNTKYKIFNDLINTNTVISENIYKLIFEYKEIILPYSTISSFNSNGINIFKGMTCDIYNYQWIIDNDYITILCNYSSEYKLLPNGINKFLADYDNYSKNMFLCNTDTCNCECLINSYKCRKNVI